MMRMINFDWSNIVTIQIVYALVVALIKQYNKPEK